MIRRYVTMKQRLVSIAGNYFWQFQVALRAAHKGDGYWVHHMYKSRGAVQTISLYEAVQTIITDSTSIR